MATVRAWLRAALLAAALGAGVSQLAQCSPPTALVGGRNLNTEMTKLKPAVMNAMKSQLGQFPQLSQMITTQTKGCQFTCLDKNVENVMVMMCSTGKLYQGDPSNLLNEALTGAFRTCYPESSYDMVKPYIASVVQVAGQAAAARRLESFVSEENELQTARRLQTMPACAAPSSETTAFTTGVVGRSKTALDGELAKTSNSQVKTYIMGQGKQCQLTCYENVLSMAMNTFHDDGLLKNQKAASMASDIVLGTLKSCFPGIPRYVLKDMAGPIAAAAGGQPSRGPATPTAPAAPGVPSGVPSGSTCAPRQGTVNGVPEAQFLTGFKSALGSAFDSVKSTNYKMNTFLNGALQCQFVCMQTVWESTALTLWRTGRLAPGNAADSKLLASSLTAGFKACYPSPPLDAVQQFTGEIVPKVMGTAARRLLTEDASAQGRRLLGGAACKGSTGASIEWVTQFVKHFQPAMKQVVNSHPNPQVKTFFANVKDCQDTCMLENVQTAASTFMNTGMIENPTESKNWFLELMTGAFRTCYPAAPRDAVHTMIQNALTSMTIPWPSAPTRAQAAASMCAGTSVPLPPFNKNLAGSMSFIMPAINQALAETTATEPQFKDFMMGSTKNCQESCFQSNLNTAVSTLFLDGNFRADMLKESITGAFRSCYPTPPRAFMLDFMNKVVAKAQAIAPSRRLTADTEPAPRRLAGSCQAADPAYVDKFMAAVPAAMGAAMKSSSSTNQYFMNARECQNSCGVKVMREAFTTFAASGLANSANSQTLVTDLISGALKACYPGLSHADVLVLVKDMLPSIQQGMSTLYDVQSSSPGLIERVSHGPVGWAAAVASAMVFGVAVMLALRRRAKGLQVRQVSHDAAADMELLVATADGGGCVE